MVHMNMQNFRLELTHVHTALDSFMLIDREIKSNDRH